MLLSILRAAVRRRAFSLSLTLVLGAVWTALLGSSVPVVLLGWAVLGALGLEVWHTLEVHVLERLGCRQPGRADYGRLDPMSRRLGICLMICEDSVPWVTPGVRSVLVSRGALDLLDDRPLLGLIAQAAAHQRTGSLVGEALVWLGNLPLVLICHVGRWLNQVGVLLAVAIGSVLVLPMLLWPRGFVSWTGRVLGSVLLGLIGSALLSNGLAAPGLGLLAGWALLWCLRVLLGWESRRAEAVADAVIIREGQGWQLLEALETLAVLGAVCRPRGLLAPLCLVGAPLQDRIDRIWRQLSTS